MACAFYSLQAIYPKNENPWVKHILFQLFFVQHTIVHVIKMKLKKNTNKSKYAYSVPLLKPEPLTNWVDVQADLSLC